MKDINFFTAYDETNKQGKGQSGRKSVIIALSVILGVLMVVGLGGMLAGIFIMNSEMKKIDEYLSSAEIKTKLAEYKDVKTLNDGYVKYIGILDNLIKQGDSNVYADSDILSRIYGAIPAGGQITALNITGRAVSVSGTLQSRDIVPSLIINLKNAGRLSDVFVESEVLQAAGVEVIVFVAKCTVEGSDVK